jgi:hypothetical protein
MFKAALAAGLSAVLLSGGAAAAQTTPERSPQNRADLQCLGVTVVGLGLTEGSEVEQIGLAAAMGYYIGRLEARAPGVNWLNAFETYLTTDFENEVEVQAERCAREMKAFGDRLSNWGEKMDSLGSKKPIKETRPRQHRP